MYLFFGPVQFIGSSPFKPFFFFDEPEVLLREKTNYTGKQASP